MLLDAEKGVAAHSEGPRPSAETHSPSAGSPTSPLVVRWDTKDPRDPHHWPAWKRYGVVTLASWLNVLVCIGASGYSTGAEGVMTSFGVSNEVATVGLSLYIVRVFHNRVCVGCLLMQRLQLGFAFGPMLLAPFSEFFGRKPVVSAGSLVSSG